MGRERAKKTWAAFKAPPTVPEPLVVLALLLLLGVAQQAAEGAACPSNPTQTMGNRKYYKEVSERKRAQNVIEALCAQPSRLSRAPHPQIDTNKRTFAASKIHCTGLGMKLAEFDNSAEYDKIHDIIREWCTASVVCN